jgi:ABC-type bacteriocin/lantibiotic exporter with double-glycine peptidase domain
MITGVLQVICLNVSTVSASLFIAFYYSWKLTLIVIGLSPLLVISGSINMALMKKLTSKSEEGEKFLGSLISDTVCNIRTVKSFGNPLNFIKIF